MINVLRNQRLSITYSVICCYLHCCLLLPTLLFVVTYIVVVCCYIHCCCLLLPTLLLFVVTYIVVDCCYLHCCCLLLPTLLLFVVVVIVAVNAQHQQRWMTTWHDCCGWNRSRWPVCLTATRTTQYRMYSAFWFHGILGWNYYQLVFSEHYSDECSAK